MPPQKSLIAELLRKQAKPEQVEREPSVGPHEQESSYYNLDLHVGDDVRLSQSTIATFSSTSDQFSPISTGNIQKNTYQCPLSNIDTKSHEFPELSDSGSAELPTGGSYDSLNSHNAFEIFAWNQKKKWGNPEGTTMLGTVSEYCYCSSNNQPY
ncbi:hypothetical protein LOAG_03640 [Loa loa]|uniref:Ovule protein n=1 Tax=Loa loa TaxID=7209 RepID=A0A1I7VPM4_LOALO|nr:hypothetical protein LOAG_03640 [Loa loa]EFO24848.1 hypothetical protein LOAG_03640 [Loa loa]